MEVYKEEELIEKDGKICEEVMPMVEYQAAEIIRLKAELARTERIIEQADLRNRFDVIQDRIYENYQDGDYYTDKEKCPELYAHLAGKVKG